MSKNWVFNFWEKKPIKKRINYFKLITNGRRTVTLKQLRVIINPQQLIKYLVFLETEIFLFNLIFHESVKSRA